MQNAFEVFLMKCCNKYFNELSLDISAEFDQLAIESQREIILSIEIFNSEEDPKIELAKAAIEKLTEGKQLEFVGCIATIISSFPEEQRYVFAEIVKIFFLNLGEKCNRGVVGWIIDSFPKTQHIELVNIAIPIFAQNGDILYIKHLITKFPREAYDSLIPSIEKAILIFQDRGDQKSIKQITSLFIATEGSTGTTTASTSNQCVIMCIDASMDPDYIKIQEKEFLKLYNALRPLAKESLESHNQLLKLEDKITTSNNNLEYSNIAFSIQQGLRFEPIFRYFCKLLQVNLPKINLSSEVKYIIDFTLGSIKINGNNDLLPGQFLDSSSYYATLKIYETLDMNIPVKQPSDLISFIEICVPMIVIGGLIAIASNSPIYGATSGAAQCLAKYEIFQQEPIAYTLIRYAADSIVGVCAVNILSNNNPVLVFMGMINAVVMTDVTLKVAFAVTELGFNGLNSEVSNYHDEL